METRRRTICCEALTRKPRVKIRALGFKPSSGSLAQETFEHGAGIFNHNATEPQIEKFADRHRRAVLPWQR